MNADIVYIKSLYFESGSKRLEPGEEYCGLHSKFSIPNGRISSHFDSICLKLQAHVYFMVFSHSMR